MFKGFRSSPAADVQQLDAELAAFEAGQLHVFKHFSEPSYHNFDQEPIQTEETSATDASNWAADFQKLFIENDQSQPSSQPFSQGPAATRLHGNFASDASSQSIASFLDLHPKTYQPSIGYPIQNAFPSQVPIEPWNFAGISEEMSRDEELAGFDEAFDRVDMDLQLQQGAEHLSNSEPTVSGLNWARRAASGQWKETSPNLGSRAYRRLTEEEIASAKSQDENMQRSGSAQAQTSSALSRSQESSRVADDEYTHLADPYFHNPYHAAPLEAALAEPPEPHQESAKDDADALANTANQLLENVKNDQSIKFQQSNFLSLMRQLRDREVHVEGDKIVDVSPSN